MQHTEKPGGSLQSQTTKQNILKWVACAVTLAGALCTSLRIDPLNIYLLNLACVLYLYWSIWIKERSLIVVNAGLLAIYAIGLFFG